MEEEMVKISRKEYEDLWAGCYDGAQYRLRKYKKMRKMFVAYRKGGLDRDKVKTYGKYAWENRVDYIRFRKAVELDVNFL